MRVKGSRPGQPDTWKPGPGPAQAPRPEADQPTPANRVAEGEEAEAGPTPGPDLAVAAEATSNVAAITQAAGEAGQALAAGDLPAALAAQDLDGGHQQQAEEPGTLEPSTTRNANLERRTPARLVPPHPARPQRADGTAQAS